MQKVCVNMQSNINAIDENTLTQAIVKAYQIIEENKKKEKDIPEKQEINNIKVNQEKWHEKVLFLLNVLFWPWKIHKRFAINNQIYDSILVLFVSLVLGVTGTIMWGIGVAAVIGGIALLIQGFVVSVWTGIVVTGVVLMLFGSLLILAENEFSKVSDSNRIYAYSASIIALISCVVAVVSLIKQFA